MCLHQALTNYLKWFPCGDFLSKGQKIGHGNGAISIQDKKNAAAEKEGNCLEAEAYKVYE